jgi:hypothetical protein
MNEYMNVENRKERLLARNNIELNEVKKLFSNEIYHSMKTLGGEYWCSNSKEVGIRSFSFWYGGKTIEVDIRVID